MILVSSPASRRSFSIFAASNSGLVPFITSVPSPIGTANIVVAVNTLIARGCLASRGRSTATSSSSPRSKTSRTCALADVTEGAKCRETHFGESLTKDGRDFRSSSKRDPEKATTAFFFFFFLNVEPLRLSAASLHHAPRPGPGLKPRLRQRPRSKPRRTRTSPPLTWTRASPRPSSRRSPAPETASRSRACLKSGRTPSRPRVPGVPATSCSTASSVSDSRTSASSASSATAATSSTSRSETPPFVRWKLSLRRRYRREVRLSRKLQTHELPRRKRFRCC